MRDRFDPEDLQRFNNDLMNALYQAHQVAREAGAVRESKLLSNLSDAVEHRGLDGLLEQVQAYTAPAAEDPLTKNG